jgi:hypothetical protein
MIERMESANGLKRCREMNYEGYFTIGWRDVIDSQLIRVSMARSRKDLFKTRNSSSIGMHQGKLARERPWNRSRHDLGYIDHIGAGCLRDIP